MRSVRIPFFQIWYSSVFLTLAFATWVATFVSPADMVYQCIRTRNIPNGISVGAVYVLTILVAFFILASRIYTNRAVLREIPRNYIPVETGEVPKKVHKMIVKQWKRSAIVAWDSRPRDVREEMLHEVDMHGENTERHGLAGWRKGHAKEITILEPHAAAAVWGYISHPGWSSPASDNLPNLEYYRVFIELPNLIEAKAVSLAPPDPIFLQNELMGSDLEPVPDARIVALLQRPSTLGLRDYVDKLGSFNLINPPEAAEAFLAQYELARFSTGSLSERQFQNLMATFSALLTGMTGLDPAVIEPELEGSSSSSSLRSFPASETSSHLRVKRLSAFSAGMDSRRTSRYSHVRSNSTGTVHTALSRAKTPQPLYRMPSEISLASQPESVTRSRIGDELLHSSSNLSLRSNGSVIRLHPSPGPDDEPYEYVFD